MNLLKRYAGASYSIRTKARIFMILLPLSILIVAMLMATTVVIEHRVNPVFLLIMGISGACFLLLIRGHYGSAVNIFLVAVTLLAGADYLSKTTVDHYVYTHHPATLYNLFCLIVSAALFSNRIMVLATALLTIGFNWTFCFLASPHASGLNLSVLNKTIMESSIAAAVLCTVCILIISIKSRAFRELEQEFKKNEEQYGVILRLIDSINSTSLSLSAHSAELLSKAGEFSDNSTAQAGFIEEVTASAEQMSSSVEIITGNVETQNAKIGLLMEQITDLSDSIVVMNGKIERMRADSIEIVSSIDDEKKYNLSMLESINGIKSSSGKMTTIMEILRTISEQINLLSLNATIEAARAGEAGRAFSVVATQIAVLSGRTNASLKEIDDLIIKSFDEINRGLANIDSSSRSNTRLLEKVNCIIAMIGDVYDHMKAQGEINEKVSGDAGLIQNASEDIKVSAQEQASVIGEIVKSVMMFNSINQSYAEGSEVLARKAGDVKRLADSLRERVDVGSGSPGHNGPLGG
ncbi:MAG: hypothetical protein JXA20_14600 [Spirochaetes bacterium]|nr:hypothetical protein [Spirochaetota bacterium]